MIERASDWHGAVQRRPEANDLRAVARVNRWFERAWAAGLLPEPTLDAAVLEAVAERKEGAALVPGEWVAPYRLLLDELAGAAHLNPLGRVIAHGQVVKLLRQRIRAERLWRERPEIGERAVTAPVVILGQMRSGTTRLHRLLACDPQFAHTRLFETLTPVARSRVEGIAPAAVGTNILRFCNPQLRAIHPTGPLAAEEEFGLHGFSFHGAMFEAQWHVPRVGRMGESRDLAPVYAEFRRLVQTLGWRRGDDPARPVLLKAPQFMQDIDALLGAFPDARLLRLTRDPAKVVASTASLVWNQQRVQSDRTDPARVGAEWLRKTNLRRARADAALAGGRPALTLSYDEFGRDWRREVRRIYDFLDLRLSPAVEQRMARSLGRAKSHHGHRYSLAQFGLSEADVSPQR